MVSRAHVDDPSPAFWLGREEGGAASPGRGEPMTEREEIVLAGQHGGVEY